MYFFSFLFFFFLFQMLPDAGGPVARTESKEQCSEQIHYQSDQGLFLIITTVVKFSDQEVGFLQQMLQNGLNL